MRLFLPEIHAEAASRPPPLSSQARQTRHGYAGQRRRILVVDNEEPDRELLRQLLEPLGFELRLAASGHDALDLLAAGYQPHAVFMDLAMPGIDGWETLRRMQDPAGPAAGRPWPCTAIVSANAFDKALDNDLGITPSDFFVKPVRHSELLDWLERRLGLQWLDEPFAPACAAEPSPQQPQALHLPDAAMLAPLRHAVALGYYRGILQALTDLENTPGQMPDQHADFVAYVRTLAQSFQFDAIARLLHDAPPAPEPPP